jgi:hypothetical protein
MLYKIKITPESFSQIIKHVDYNGKEVGVYRTVSEVLTGTTNNQPIISSFNIPILLKQNYIDFGYYSEFDGAILQKETVLNFVFSAITEYEYLVLNTSNNLNNFTKDANYVIDWGDGTVEGLITNPMYHTYSTGGLEYYTIVITQTNNFGTNIIKKNVIAPFDATKVSDNPNGTAEFIPSGGPWKGTPLSYDYIFSGDSGSLEDYVNTTPTQIGGYTYSKIKDLASYGTDTYPVGKPIYIDNILLGQIDSMSIEYSAYTIQNISYVDYPNGLTIFNVETSGLTTSTTTLSGITKDEVLLKSVSSPQIFSNVFIERGKVSGYEKVLRLGEVKTIEDLENYGYGFFKLENK